VGWKKSTAGGHCPPAVGVPLSVSSACWWFWSWPAAGLVCAAVVRGGAAAGLRLFAWWSAVAPRPGPSRARRRPGGPGELADVRAPRELADVLVVLVSSPTSGPLESSPTSWWSAVAAAAGVVEGAP
jgi:hypothetical protein